MFKIINLRKWSSSHIYEPFNASLTYSDIQKKDIDLSIRKFEDLIRINIENQKEIDALMLSMESNYVIATFAMGIKIPVDIISGILPFGQTKAAEAIFDQVPQLFRVVTQIENNTHGFNSEELLFHYFIPGYSVVEDTIDNVQILTAISKESAEIDESLTVTRDELIKFRERYQSELTNLKILRNTIRETESFSDAFARKAMANRVQAKSRIEENQALELGRKIYIQEVREINKKKFIKRTKSSNRSISQAIQYADESIENILSQIESKFDTLQIILNALQFAAAISDHVASSSNSEHISMLGNMVNDLKGEIEIVKNHLESKIGLQKPIVFNMNISYSSQRNFFFKLIESEKAIVVPPKINGVLVNPG